MNLTVEDQATTCPELHFLTPPANLRILHSTKNLT